MNEETCHAIKCERFAHYYAVAPDGVTDGIFCYSHYPSEWAIATRLTLDPQRRDLLRFATIPRERMSQQG